MRKKIVGLSTKTCKMKPGVFFIAKAQKFYSDANMDDDTARVFLGKGYLKPEMFIKLPEAPVNTVKMVDEAGEALPAEAPTQKPKKRRKSPKK